MIVNSFTWKIGGRAGEGIKVTGYILSKVFQRLGLNVFGYIEYPSLVRGGHNVYQIRAEAGPAPSHLFHDNLLVALNQESVNLHHQELTPHAGIIYDPAKVKLTDHDLPDNVNPYPIPLLELVKEAGAKPVMVNVVALGATLQLLDIPFEYLEAVINDQFCEKGEAIVKSNVTVARKGYEYAKDNFDEKFNYTIKPMSAKPRVMLSGNEAIALGAIHGGCNYYVAYPMTPSSSILDTMAAMADKHGIMVKHAEDEIGVMNMAIGASYAGARTMLGTSGGGFALMGEGLGLAGMTETPLVIAEVQRPGPATGLPTWTEQGDLRMLMHAAQGEFPRIILAPGDIEEAFYLSAWALNLAEKYQLPVFILSDKYLSESYLTAPVFDQKKIMIDRGKMLSDAEAGKESDYKRYKVTADGVSPRAIPGQPNTIFLANSDEHDEYGYSEESSANRIAQMDKRLKKCAVCRTEMPLPKLYGPAEAEFTFIAWGSMKGPVLEAMQMLKMSGIETNLLHLNIVWPFPTGKVEEVINNARTTILVENNATSQLGGIIREETGQHTDHQFLKYDGRPPHPHELHEYVEKLKNK
ncbi:MAG: 2-oxoacid:acceptor oxidoreductase subunit alpha [Patescibacteria group bacterium]